MTDPNVISSSNLEFAHKRRSLLPFKSLYKCDAFLWLYISLIWFNDNVTISFIICIYIYFLFCSTGKKYPFYGVQYHPEKNIFDWDGPLNVDHSRNAIAFAQGLADFFVQQGREYI